MLHLCRLIDQDGGLDMLRRLTPGGRTDELDERVDRLRGSAAENRVEVEELSEFAARESEKQICLIVQEEYDSMQ